MHLKEFCEKLRQGMKRFWGSSKSNYLNEAKEDKEGKRYRSKIPWWFIPFLEDGPMGDQGSSMFLSKMKESGEAFLPPPPKTALMMTIGPVTQKPHCVFWVCLKIVISRYGLIPFTSQLLSHWKEWKKQNVPRQRRHWENGKVMFFKMSIPSLQDKNLVLSWI